MVPKFSKDSKVKASKQGIETSEIFEMLASKKTLSIASKYDEDAMLSYGVIKDKHWVIVSNWQSRTIITLYPAKEKERMFYEQENRP